jgi:hypothetical protein
MSYSIFYRTCCIKIDAEHTILAIEAGDSNCYEQRTGRRARDWQGYTYYSNKRLIATNADVLAAIDAELETRIKHATENSLVHPEIYRDFTPDDVKNRFGYYAGLAVGNKSCATTSFSSLRNFFANGIKNALTIEELREQNIFPSLRSCSYIHEALNGTGIAVKERTHPTTTEQLIKGIEDFEEHYKHIEYSYSKFHLDLGGDLEDLKRLKTKTEAQLF